MAVTTVEPKKSSTMLTETEPQTEGERKEHRDGRNPLLHALLTRLLSDRFIESTVAEERRRRGVRYFWD